MLKTHQHVITESIIFLEQPRPSFLANFKATQNELGQKRQHHSVYMIYLCICISIYLCICRNVNKCGFYLLRFLDYQMEYYIYIYVTKKTFIIFI